MSEYITDTDALIFALDDALSSKLGDEARKAFQETEAGGGVIKIPSVVLVQLLQRENTSLALQVLSLIETDDQKYKILPLDEKVANAFTRIDKSIPDLFDRIIAATALVEKCPVITSNPYLRSHRKIRTMWESTVENNNSSLPTIGIVTALEKEYHAVSLMLEGTRNISVTGARGSYPYLLGRIPAYGEGHWHDLVLVLLTNMGNNPATQMTTRLLDDFPSIKCVVNVGIAGGVPAPEKPEVHIRLGDIAVCKGIGVIQYDFNKETSEGSFPRYPPRPPDPQLLRFAQQLSLGALRGEMPWLKFVGKTGAIRPTEDQDILVSSTDPEQVIEHPNDNKRIPQTPRLFLGPIGSANMLLKNPIKRDELRERDGIIAIEMEGSGVAEAAWSNRANYFIIRGVCDYCDSKKNDVWQEYAASVAAAFLRALLEATPVLLK